MTFNEKIVYGIRISIKNQRMDKFKKLFKIYFHSEISYIKNFNMFCDMYFNVPHEIQYEFLFLNEMSGEMKWKIMSEDDFEELENQNYEFDEQGNLIVLSKFLVNGVYV